MSTVPSDEALTEHIQLILTKAHQDGTIGDHTKRKVREMLSDHFSACLESPKTKKKVNAMVEEQNDLITRARQHQPKGRASTSKSASPVKTVPVKSAKAKTPKRKRPSAAAESDDGSDGEAAYKAPAAPVAVSSDTEPASEDFSELEEDTSTSRARPKKPKATTTKKASSSSAAPKRKPASKPSGSDAEQRLTRLKKLVSECGVHKQWKRLYEAAGVDAADVEAQCRIVQGVLRELGMTGKGSLEQARKIRDQREFNEELAALQENEVVGKTRGARQTRASLGEGTKKSKTIEISDTDESGSEFDEAPPEKARKVLSDSDEDQEDDGSAPKKSFNKSLASFVADINSDSD